MGGMWQWRLWRHQLRCAAALPPPTASAGAIGGPALSRALLTAGVESSERCRRTWPLRVSWAAARSSCAGRTAAAGRHVCSQAATSVFAGHAALSLQLQAPPLPPRACLPLLALPHASCGAIRLWHRGCTAKLHCS